MVRHQSIFVHLKTISNVKRHFNRLYAIDANSHHACAASETRLTRIRVSCTVLTFGRDSSTKEESTYPWRSTTSSTVVPVITPIVKRVDHITLSASIEVVGKYINMNRYNNII